MFERGDTVLYKVTTFGYKKKERGIIVDSYEFGQEWSGNVIIFKNLFDRLYYPCCIHGYMIKHKEHLLIEKNYIQKYIDDNRDEYD